MLLLIEFARTMMDNSECVVIYYEPVSHSIENPLKNTTFSLQNWEDITNQPIGSTDLVVFDPELDLVMSRDVRPND